MKISNGFLIREVQKVDNKAIETTLSKIMREFDVPETGTALADPELKICLLYTSPSPRDRG